MVIVREITPEDAENFVELDQQIAQQTDFMLLEPGERQVTPEQQRQRIDSMGEQGNSTFFVAETGGKLVGYLVVIGGSAKRNKHSAYLVVGIIKDYRGQGVGTKLFKHMERWAVDRGITRLELTVMKHNEAGLALYKKMGFEIEGTKRHSLLVRGEFVDEFYMAKIRAGT